MSRQFWDITPLVTSDFPLWPDSTALQRKIQVEIQKGSIVTSSDLTATVHLGAHADAPSHYAKEGISIDQCDLKYYLGPCQVVRPKVAKGEAITRKHFKEILAPRLLFATSTFDFKSSFKKDFASFAPDFFEYLAKSGTITIGIDTPSVDLFDALELPCHQLAYQYKVALLENLDLSEIAEGLYELIALPLKIQGFDASPVRAVLRSLN